MSSIPANSIASQPPVAPVQPVTPRQPDNAAAERAAAKAKELTATAVAAQSAKEAGKGLVIDIQT